MFSPIYLETAEKWRAWLQENHASASGVWLLFYKKGFSRPTITYEAAVEDALCFGWIDSVIRRVDEYSYARKFTPRKNDSKWSPSNKKRVEKLIACGRMTEIGLAKIEAAKKNGMWDQPDRPQLKLNMSQDFATALAANPAAKQFFEQLAPSYQKQYLGWIEVAKRPETRENRIRESLDLLNRGEKLGMK